MDAQAPTAGEIAASLTERTWVFVLLDAFSLLALTSAIEPLRIANAVAARPLYRWQMVGGRGGSVVANNGLRIEVDGAVGDVNLADGPVVAVCGGNLATEAAPPEEMVVWLHRAAAAGLAVGAVAGGSALLARAGLLAGRRCAVDWETLPAFVRAFPDVEATADVFVDDAGRFTCPDGTAALDLMLQRIAGDHGAALATRVAERCVLDRIRSPDDRERLPIRARLGVHHPKLILAVELMEANTAEPLSQDLLAAYVGLSRRQLERLFKQHVGRSPAQYYLELRLERARRLLYRSEMAIMDVARDCGFVSASHFATCYRQLYGRTPRQERNGAG